VSRHIVIGGGIAGLTAAHRLRAAAPQADVLLLEGAERPGGHVHTIRDGGFVVEAGPNGFLARANEPEPMALVRELGLEGALIEAQPAAKRRFVWLRGRLRLAPSSPPSLLSTDALSPAGKLRLALEPFVRSRSNAGESVHAFAARRLGREAADALVDPAVSGVSAGDSRALEAAAAFPMLVEMEREHGSLLRAMLARRAKAPRLVSFLGGLGTLTEALARRLGSAVRTHARVQRLAPVAGGWHVLLDSGEWLDADAVVIATSAANAAALLAPVDAELSRELAGFPQAGLGVVAMAFRAADLPRPLDGYGFLAARGHGLNDTLGVVWESSLFAGRAPAGHVLVRAMLGGARRPEVPELDAPSLLERARRELATAMGVRAMPVRHWVWRWPRAITQYTPGHLERVARVRARLAQHPGLELCGTSYDGISFTAAMVSAERAAARLLELPVAEPKPEPPRFTSLTLALRRDELPATPNPVPIPPAITGPPPVSTPLARIDRCADMSS